MKQLPKILMVYIEPTPYVLGLINALVVTYQGKIDILFLSENISQNWKMKVEQHCMMLPKKWQDKIRLLQLLLFKNKYDLIHLAGWGRPLLLLFIFTAKFLRIPLAVESDTPLMPHTPLWKRVIKRLLYPSLFRLINIFLPGGTQQAKYFLYYGVKQNSIVPVQMTVDVTGIQKFIWTLNNSDRLEIRKRYGINEQQVVFLYVGRLVPHKGIHDLIDSFHRVKNSNAVLLIVGDGSLNAFVQEAVKANKKIYYAGRLDAVELIKIYYSADVLVLPSHVEPWGLVVNEAMASGLPVIVSDRVGCIDDLVTHQKTGLIVKAACIDALCAAMEDLSGSSQKRIMMKEQSILKIKDWTLENEAKKICQAWHPLLDV